MRLALVCLVCVGCGDDSMVMRDASGGDASPDALDTPDTNPVDTGLDTGVDAGPGPGDWRLPDGYFTEARMPMTLVHPRNSETPDWVYSKNAHPDVRWEIPIVVQGGAWPFQYSIVDDGGAAGLAIGGELQRRSESGFVVHEVTPEYGVLWWDNPVAGTYEIQLRVTDQEGATLDVPVSLNVGTAGWVFIDADEGNASGDGTIDSPFATLADMHERDSTSTRFANHRVYLSGTVAMDGNRPNGNLRIDPGFTPAVWVGRPGRDAVLEAYEGKFVVASSDFYVGNLEYRHRADYAPDDGFLHMLTVWQAPRYTMHDVTFSRFQGVGTNVDLGNSSVMMFTRGGSTRPHVAIVNCTITGPSGVFTSTYTLRHSVFEKNRWENAQLSLADGSVAAIIYIKADNEDVTIRANRMFVDNEWSGLSGIGINQARRIEIAHNSVETPYDTGRGGSLRLFTNSSAAGFTWTAETPVWVDRNSVRQRMSWEGEALANMPDGTVHIDNNAVVQPVPSSSRIVSGENLEGDVFDGTLNLMGPARDEYLGRRGAEIAVPE